MVACNVKHKAIEHNADLQLIVLNEHINISLNNPTAYADTINLKFINTSDLTYYFTCVDTTVYYSDHPDGIFGEWYSEPFDGIAIRFLDREKKVLLVDQTSFYSPENFESIDTLSLSPLKLVSPDSESEFHFPIKIPNWQIFSTFYQEIPDIENAAYAHILFEPLVRFTEADIKTHKISLGPKERILSKRWEFILPIELID